MIENVPEDEPETILMREALFERDRLTEKDDRGKPREENFDGGIDKPSFFWLTIWNCDRYLILNRNGETKIWRLIIHQLYIYWIKFLEAHN